MARDDQAAFFERILEWQLGDFVSWTAPTQVPLLGQKYHEDMRTLIKRADDFRSNQRDALLFLDTEDLDQNYNLDGSLKDSSLEDYWSEIKKATPVQRYTHEIYQAGLGRPDLLPDYDY